MKAIIFSLNGGQQFAAHTSNPVQAIADVYTDGFISDGSEEYPITMISKIEVER